MDNMLKILRKRNNLTQEQVANKLGYHLTTYKRWERNENEIKLIDAKNIADFYGVKIDELVKQP